VGGNVTINQLRYMKCRVNDIRHGQIHNKIVNGNPVRLRDRLPWVPEVSLAHLPGPIVGEKPTWSAGGRSRNGVRCQRYKLRTSSSARETSQAPMVMIIWSWKDLKKVKSDWYLSKRGNLAKTDTSLRPTPLFNWHLPTEVTSLRRERRVGRWHS